jgi:GNAT superfamily N-acetyltransferase
MKELAKFAGEGAYGFGARVNGELAAVCWYWVGDRYKARNYWPLKPHEAKLVQITTLAPFRGRGIATQLIDYATMRMRQHGFVRFYARIWHSNKASIVAFTRAGWIHAATVCDIFPFGTKARWRYVRWSKQRARATSRMNHHVKWHETTVNVVER